MGNDSTLIGLGRLGPETKKEHETQVHLPNSLKSTFSGILRLRIC